LLDQRFLILLCKEKEKGNLRKRGKEEGKKTHLMGKKKKGRWEFLNIVLMGLSSRCLFTLKTSTRRMGGKEKGKARKISTTHPISGNKGRNHS